MSKIENHPQLSEKFAYLLPFFRPDVKLTGKLELLWLQRDPELQGQIAWTYIGTMGGVMRIYPGVELPRDFDPAQ